MAGPEAYLPLLRMSIGLQGKEQNGDSSAPPAQEMDAERKQWLKDAMASALKNPIDDMKLALKRISAEQSTEEDKVESLESLASFVEQVDLARDLHKLGGLATVISLLDDPSHRVRASAACVIGTTVHNNPEPQKWATELGALEGLTKALNRRDATPQELAKEMFGLSSLIRQNDAATVTFVKELKGVALILDILKNTSHADEELLPARRKALFTLLYLITRAPAIVPPTASHCVPALSTSLKRHLNDPDFREHAVKVLQIYATNKGVQLVIDEKKEVVESVTLALEASKQDEQDDAIKGCEAILASWNKLAAA